MANMLLPVEEQNLTPDQVEALDRRRHKGLVYQTIAGQMIVVSTVLLLWVGQDLTYSPGFRHPIAYYLVTLLLIGAFCGVRGTYLRRGSYEYSDL